MALGILGGNWPFNKKILDTNQYTYFYVVSVGVNNFTGQASLSKQGINNRNSELIKKSKIFSVRNDGSTRNFE